VTCGVGCAASRTACLGVILNQVKEVAIAASKVAAFFTGGSAGVALATVVEQVVKLAEFGFNVLTKVLEIAQTAFQMYAREEAQLATLIAIFEMAKQSAGEIAGDVQSFLGLVETSVPLFLQVVDAQFGWTNINLEWIANAVMQNGGAALQGAFKVATAFAFGKCQIADDTVEFTIEEVGDARVVGPWTEDGVEQGKPRYRGLLDRQNTMISWSRRSNTWGIWVVDTSFGKGWWFGWAGFKWRELYQSSANTPTVPLSNAGWTRIEGVLPLPWLVSARNGGI